VGARSQRCVLCAYACEGGGGAGHGVCVACNLLDGLRPNLLVHAGRTHSCTAGTALYRTDIFPGLGWMTTAAVGKELFQKWPDVYWDDW
jgi:hypothetical protein